MRLLLAAAWYLPHISGMTLALQRLAREMAARGHEVTVLAGRHEPELPREETCAGVRTRRVPVLLRLGKALFVPGMAAAAWREAGRADAVHLWLPHPDAALVALAARLRGRPVIATYNCSLTSPGIAGALAVAAVNASHLVAGLLCRRIVVVSEDYAAQSRFCRLFRRKLDFVDVPVPGWPDAPAAYRPPTPPFRIGFVGRLAREKGLGTLVGAVRHLRDRLAEGFSVEIAGPVDDLPGGPALPDGDGLPPEMSILGPLDDVARDAFLRGLDVLVLPSRERIEAFGLVQVEAMLRGVPCVASDLPGMRQPVLRSGFGRLFRAGDAGALAEALVAVLREGPPCRPGPEEIAEEFSNERTFERYGALYAGLARQ